MAQRTAIVLSGGGAKGAYEIGVLRALVTGAAPSTYHRPIDPGIFTGTSVGAFNGAVLACQPGVPCEVALDRLERIWRRRIADRLGTCGNGVFRLRGLPVQDLEPQCFVPTPARVVQLMADSAYLAGEMATTAAQIFTSDRPLTPRLLSALDATAFFDPEPLHRLIDETVDFEGLARSRKELTIVASRWREGTPRLFDAEELAARRRSAPILASMAIPGIFPQIWIDGEPYVDGALSMNTPIKPAIRAGADVIHVIFLDPRIADSEVNADSTFDTLARVFSILAAEQVKSDMRRADDVNRGIELLEGAAAIQAAPPPAPPPAAPPPTRPRYGQRADEEKPQAGPTPAAPRAAEQHLDTRTLSGLAAVATRLAAPGGRRYRKVEIHAYRPRGGLAKGAELLDFSIDHIDSLIRQGYEDAAHHDCEVEQCSLFESDVRAGARAALFRSARGERMTLR